jgi:hypothetical protein
MGADADAEREKVTAVPDPALPVDDARDMTPSAEPEKLGGCDFVLPSMTLKGMSSALSASWS